MSYCPFNFGPALIQEEWRPVVWPGITMNMYFVSNCGRVCNDKGQILKLYLINSGYYVAKLFKDKETRKTCNNRFKAITIHRLVLSTFCPVPNMNELTVNHKDGNKANNCLWNLEWMTQRENNFHSYRTGLNNNRGENNKQAKFTEEQVVTICKILQSGNYTNYSDILSRLGMELTDNNRDMVGNIKRRIAWKWISKNYNW